MAEVTEAQEVWTEALGKHHADTVRELKSENAGLQAQIAMMAEALGSCASGDEWKETEALVNSLYSPVAFACQVCTELLEEFSAAPKVIAIKTLGIGDRMSWDAIRYLGGQPDWPWVCVETRPEDERLDGARIIILADEQDQDSEQEE